MARNNLKNQMQFMAGVLLITTLIALGPYLRNQLLPTAFNEMVDKKDIDVSSLFYTESEQAAKAAFALRKERTAADKR